MSNPITQEFLEYLDNKGELIAPTKNGGSLNGVLYTSIALIVMNDNNSLSEEVKEHLAKHLSRCFLEPGLLTRTPEHHTDQQGPDDYVGITAAAYILNLPFAKEVYEYGQRITVFGPLKLKYVYNNTNPGTLTEPLRNPVDLSKQSTLQLLLLRLWGKPDHKINVESWLGRQLQLRAHFAYASDHKPNLFLRIFWSLVIWHSARYTKPNDQDGWMLAWLLVRTLNGRSWIGNLASKYWYKKMYEVFPSGLKELKYLEGNTNHPITKYWVK